MSDSYAFSSLKHNILKDEAIKILKDEEIFENVIKIFNENFNNIIDKNKFSINEDGSLVSKLEKEIEREIGIFLAKKTPWASFQGEEGYNYQAQGNFKWFLDPIDGTISFKNGLDTFGLTLSLVDGFDVIASIVYFPKLSITYIAIKGKGVTVEGRPLQHTKNSNNSHIVVAHSDLYTFKLAQREKILTYLHNSDFIPRTYTDIYGYSLVAQQKCAAKIDAAAALWDLYPGFLLARESEVKTVFIPANNPSEDLYGSLIFGNEEIVDKIINDLIQMKVIEKNNIYINHIPKLL
ncbi:MAG: inositol monophosphatase [Candidatus Tisiphia sp.]